MQDLKRNEINFELDLKSTHSEPSKNHFYGLSANDHNSIVQNKNNYVLDGI